MLRDGPEPAAGPATELVDGLSRALVCRQEDDQLLRVRREFERLVQQLKVAPRRVVEPEDSTSRNHMTIQAPREVGAGDGHEFYGDRFQGVRDGK